MKISNSKFWLLLLCLAAASTSSRATLSYDQRKDQSHMIRKEGEEFKEFNEKGPLWWIKGGLRFSMLGQIFTSLVGFNTCIAFEEVGALALAAAWAGTGASSVGIGTEVWQKLYFADKKKMSESLGSVESSLTGGVKENSAVKKFLESLHQKYGNEGQATKEDWARLGFDLLRTILSVLSLWHRKSLCRHEPAFVMVAQGVVGLFINLVELAWEAGAHESMINDFNQLADKVDKVPLVWY